MAKQELLMPKMGESITTGTITKWHKGVGDKVELDEIILEISTDKVESEIPSPYEGIITELLYEEGDTIDVGKVIASIDDDANATVAAPAAKSAPKAEATSAPVTESAPVRTEEVATSSSEVTSTRFFTPLVRKLAQDNNISLSEIADLKGSGAGGRVNKDDFMSYLNNRGSSASTQRAASSGASMGGVDAVINRMASKPAAKPAPSKRAEPSVTFNHGERVQRIPMDNMRKAIARNMVQSKQTSPHVNSLSEVDMTHLVKFREGFKHQFQKEEGFKLTYTPFILKAIIEALQEYPMVNASIDGDDIVVKKDINLGCAVAVPGNGLVVPVIRNAEELSMRGLCRKLNDLANRARAKKLTLDELQGGTFTFTNVGSFGTLMATPVILQPQVGILAAGVIKKRVVVTEDDAIAVRHMMYGTHTYDHRLVDGELGGKFLEAVMRNLREMDLEDLF